MSWSPWIELGEYQHTHGTGIFPSWYEGWISQAQAVYNQDTDFYTTRMAAVWDLMRTGAGTVTKGSGGGVQASANALAHHGDIGTQDDYSTYTATGFLERQIIRLAPGGALLDAILEAQWQAYVAANGMVEGTDYVTPPPDQQYKTYDWAPQEEEAEVLPGGFLGLGAWTGSGVVDPIGYFGDTLQLRLWTANPTLPEVGYQTVTGAISAQVDTGGWPGHDATGAILFEWDGFGEAVQDDVNGVSSWIQPDVLHAMDLTALATNGILKLNWTSDIFDGNRPTAYPATNEAVNGANMPDNGSNDLIFDAGIRIIARAYPRVLLPDIRYWKPVIPPLRLRARDDDTQVEGYGAEATVRINTGDEGSRDYTASVQRSARIFYGPNTYA